MCVCSNRLLVTWAKDCPALCTRFGLIKQNCHLASVRFSMHLFHDQTCASAGYNNCNVVELKLETNEAVCVSLDCQIYHPLDKDSPLIQLWRYHRANPMVIYRPPLVVLTVVGIDIKMQAEVSQTKVLFHSEIIVRNRPAVATSIGRVCSPPTHPPNTSHIAGVRPLQ